jgi:2,3-bisphosphoglycerate-independent phosphoglycerate mutase
MRNGNFFHNPLSYISHEYKNQRSDEFIIPAFNVNAQFDTTLQSEDAVLFFNFRSDRMNQFASLITNQQIAKSLLLNIPSMHVTTLTTYSDKVKPQGIMLPMINVINSFGS